MIIYSENIIWKFVTRDDIQSISSTDYPRLRSWQSSDAKQHIPSAVKENTTLTFMYRCTSYPAPTIHWEISSAPITGRDEWIALDSTEWMGVMYWGGLEQVNSTLALVARPDILGHFIRCTCSAPHSNLTSDLFELLFHCMN